MREPFAAVIIWQRERGGGDPAGAGATCSRCGIRHRCPALISLARGVWGMITRLCPQRPPLSFGACLSKFDGKANERSAAQRKMACRRAAADRVCEEDAGARGAGRVFLQRGKEQASESLRASLRARLLYASAAAARTIPSARRNLNDLVGREMCHKGSADGRGRTWRKRPR